VCIYTCRTNTSCARRRVIYFIAIIAQYFPGEYIRKIVKHSEAAAAVVPRSRPIALWRVVAEFLTAVRCRGYDLFSSHTQPNRRKLGKNTYHYYYCNMAGTVLVQCVHLFATTIYTAARCYNNNIYKRVQYNNIIIYNAMGNDFTSYACTIIIIIYQWLYYYYLADLREAKRASSEYHRHSFSDHDNTYLFRHKIKFELLLKWNGEQTDWHRNNSKPREINNTIHDWGRILNKNNRKILTV